jgi:glutamate-ammonia-ligase adenylyltransferase
LSQMRETVSEYWQALFGSAADSWTNSNASIDSTDGSNDNKGEQVALLWFN